MTAKRVLRYGLLAICLFICLVIVNYGLLISSYKEVKYDLGFGNWTRSMPPFHSSSETIEFIVDGPQNVEFKLWWEGLTGEVEITLHDESNNSMLSRKSKSEMVVEDIKLDSGKYTLSVDQKSFTGAIGIGIENAIFTTKLNTENYFIMAENQEKGFHWEYILFVPENIKHNKLLVVPNNSGIATDNNIVHKEKAKRLIRSKSDLASKLGLPLLVPVFPRPDMNSSIYTHALDRNSIYTDIEELKRLDIQLLNMIDDSKKTLLEKGIQLESKVLMSGFSASGDFVDRFTFLHPEMVEAAVIGASDKIIPLECLRGEKLPYPIGVDDYKEITGKDFDLELVSQVQRYVYKGSEDQGGWQLVEENGEVSRYAWEDYYNDNILPDLIRKSAEATDDTYENASIMDSDLELIMFNALEGKILIDRFNEISSIHSSLGIEKTKFKVYDGVGHTITDQIKEDEYTYFKRILEN